MDDLVSEIRRMINDSMNVNKWYSYGMNIYRDEKFRVDIQEVSYGYIVSVWKFPQNNKSKVHLGMIILKGDDYEVIDKDNIVKEFGEHYFNRLTK